MTGFSAYAVGKTAFVAGLTLSLLAIQQYINPRSKPKIAPSAIGAIQLIWFEKVFGVSTRLQDLIQKPSLSLLTSRGPLTSIFSIIFGTSLYDYLFGKAKTPLPTTTVIYKSLRYLPQKLGLVAPDHDFDAKYQGGEDYADAEQLSTGILTDLKSVGLVTGRDNLRTLMEVGLTKKTGEPLDDKSLVTEKLIAIMVSLPHTSKTRLKLTQTFIHTLWTDLQHPPLSYLGDKFKYRQPDGSYNNILYPDLGKAGTPYARSVRRVKALHGVRPDPGLLFDMLMGRRPGSFKENPAGISSILFYHATIITHDIFRTNRLDQTISDTSSYLDLAPLYGSSLEDQLKIRTMEKGLLKPDTFSERRLLAQPPGVNVLLIMYSRFHNYCADVLLKINENGRFTLPPTKTEEDRKKAIAKQDHDLFNTARLIVNGLYINISLHDYLRAITNSHHSATDWTLDPRIEIGKQFDGEGVPRGVGNQVSAEFNLLYRFHAGISLRDEKWLEEFLASLFPGLNKPISALTPQELMQGLFRYEQSINPDPSQRNFAHVKRQADGTFKTEELVKIMTDAMEDPAGLFGARMVPKALRVVEILGIIQSRQWEMASLNEFRSFFGLKKHKKFEDINSDPEIANQLRHLYTHPDFVELYPGLFIEESKPRMDPGSGICPPYTVGRAILSDAITLVRSDRFNTIDFSPATLTNWGYQEVQQDIKVLGGSTFYKLFQRAFPGWYPFNSLHIMQPMYTWKMNKQIAEEFGTLQNYSLKGPSAPKAPVIVRKAVTIQKILKNQANFPVPWNAALSQIAPGEIDLEWYMLHGDTPEHLKQRRMVEKIMFAPADFSKLLQEYVTNVATKYVQSEGYELDKGLNQVDILRDVAIPANAWLLGDLFNLDLKGPEHPQGTLSYADVYKHLLNLRVWGFFNNEPGMAFRRRMWAGESAKVLFKTGKNVVAEINGDATHKKGFVETIKSLFKKLPIAKDPIQTGSLRWYGKHVVKELLANGLTVEQVAGIQWMTALGGASILVGLFTDILQFFLLPQNATHWAAIQSLVHSSPATADATLRQYVLEAQRLTSGQRNLRICARDITIDGQAFKKGDSVVCMFGPAGTDPSTIPEPQSFRLDRPRDAYLHFSVGPHACLGREIALVYLVSMIRVAATLKNLRAAPGAMGTLKSIQIGTAKHYLNDSWSWLTVEPTTWKLHFDGFGKGVYTPPPTATAVPAAAPSTTATTSAPSAAADPNADAGQDLIAISALLAKQAEAGPPTPPSTPSPSPSNGAAVGAGTKPANGSAVGKPANGSAVGKPDSGAGAKGPAKGSSKGGLKGSSNANWSRSEQTAESASHSLSSSQWSTVTRQQVSGGRESFKEEDFGFGPGDDDEEGLGKGKGKGSGLFGGD